jgi:hypothetical protein
MITNSSRAICGFATLFGVRSANGYLWQAEQFQRFVDLQIGVPLRVDHGSLITNRGCLRYIGIARYFAAVESPAPGLLCVAELDHDDFGFGDQVIADLVAMTSQRWLPASWGMSIGARYTEDMIVPYEVSITQSPGFEDARILGVGPEALSTWELLTGSAVTANDLVSRLRQLRPG